LLFKDNFDKWKAIKIKSTTQIEAIQTLSDAKAILPDHEHNAWFMKNTNTKSQISNLCK